MNDKERVEFIKSKVEDAEFYNGRYSSVNNEEWFFLINLAEKVFERPNNEAKGMITMNKQDIQDIIKEMFRNGDISVKVNEKQNRGRSIGNTTKSVEVCIDGEVVQVGKWEYDSSGYSPKPKNEILNKKD